MAANVYIQKASGEKVLFSEAKLHKSLALAGADPQTVKAIISQVENELVPGTSTQEIYQQALGLLASRSRPAAGRYKLKSAIMELGPSGYPFERYIGEILKYQGFVVQVGQVVQGHCVTHEVDVIALKGEQHFMVECKFHNKPGLRCDVKIPLYIQSRFKDVEKQWQCLPGHATKFHQGWVVTNTRFSRDAIQYGTCVGLRLIGWNFPPQQSLNKMIDASGLYPLTCLMTLTNAEKEQLLQNNVVLCQQVCGNESLLHDLGVSAERIPAILKEARSLCHDSFYQNISK
ncbi:MAG: restriction endonuclease [Adhaeribacter sp.]